MISLLNRLALSLAWLAAPLAGLCLAAPFLAATWLQLDFLSQFALHGGIYLAALISATLLRRLFIPAFAALALLLAAGAFVLPFVWQAAGAGDVAESAAGRGLKVLSFNLHGWVNPNLDAIEALLRAEKADVVLLLEFTRVQSPLFERLRGIYPHQADCAGDAVCHIALFSRHPLREVRLSRRNWRRIAPALARATIKAPSGDVRFIGLHLTRPTDPLGQQDQLDHVAGLIGNMGDRPLIVAGDFNSVPWSHNMRSFQSKAGLDCLNRFTPTWPMAPVKLAQFPIDQICVSKHFTRRGFKALPATGSDHRPVMAGLGM